ncbi:MAG: zf-HC2 domain-containing protein [Bryobacterales bacterium]|nr:zf-HC2 domain-containing protein [Bryobacteraceae bacterium]MDW8354687.1 zf-HC2 domain-containing protein [Bryobacterales bacterium]
MTCAELELLLCDYLDGALEPERRRQVDQHLASCSLCAELARDAASAAAYLRQVPPVEPPPELVTRILFELGAADQQTGQRRGLRALLARFRDPVLQPRLAMGMAMTILSFSMLARFAGISIRQIQPADLSPVRLWEAVDDKVHRTWARAMKFYESLRLVYEVRSRLRELTAPEEEAAVPAGEPQALQNSPGAAPSQRSP